MSTDNTRLDEILAKLNPRQREAACHGNDPLLIIAGAGTGKTTTLAHRVAWLIAQGTAPGRILLLTFTRRAAAEMLRRVEGILQQMAGSQSRTASRLSSSRIWGGTFHAIAARLLRQHGRLIGLDPDFTILDRSDSEDLLNQLRGELNLQESKKRFPLKGTCQDIFSRCMNTRQRLQTVLETTFPWCMDHLEGLDELFQKYVDRKEAERILDYDDLLLFWHALVSEESSAEVIRRQFECVLVDEYQDTNLLQAEILQNLRPSGQGLTVVGDDAQSIYSFRAATVRNILDFPQQFPGTQVVALEQNYRSTQPILNATNLVIAEAAERHAKELWSARTEGPRPLLVDCQDENEQTDLIIDRVLEQRESGVPLKQQAVLFRTSHHSIALEAELSRRNVPFHKYGGLKFIETAHVKDLIAFLRLAENPRDTVSGTRVLMLIPGIGHKTAAVLLNALHDARYDFDCWERCRIPSAAAEMWPGLCRLLIGLSNRPPEEVELAADINRVRTFYEPLLEQQYDHAAPRIRDLEQIEQVATRYPNRQTFLQEITLDPPSSTQDLPDNPLLDEDYLILSTIHSAKGLEWDSVFVMHASDGNIPSDMSTRSADQVEEERRLFYVALTRARNHLYVCFPQRYYFHHRQRSDAHSFAQLTRFLPRQVREAFDRRPAVMLSDDATAREVEATLTTADVRSRIKRSI